MAFPDDIADLIAWVDQPPPRFAGHTHTVGCTLFHSLITDCWQGNLFYRGSDEYDDDDAKKAKARVLEGALFVFPQVADFPSFKMNQVYALVTLSLVPDGELSITVMGMKHPGIPDPTSTSSQFSLSVPAAPLNSGTSVFECRLADNWFMELYRACADHSCDRSGNKI